MKAGRIEWLGQPFWGDPPETITFGQSSFVPELHFRGMPFIPVKWTPKDCTPIPLWHAREGREL